MIHPHWNDAQARAIVAVHAGREGALLPILHALQEAFGYIDGSAVPLVAEALNLSRAEVRGTLSFYHDFRSAPGGRHRVKLCRAEACQAMGGDAVHREILARLSVDWNGTTPDGAVTVEPVYCLGLCAAAPAALVDDVPLARLTAARIAARLAGGAA